MNNIITKRNSAKVIASLLSILLLWQAVAWADPDIFRKNTLQPLTLFSAENMHLGEEDTLFALVRGYLVSYLINIENNPHSQNTAEMRKTINKWLKDIKHSPNIPKESLETIPDEVEYDDQKSAILIDLGAYKIRYCNPLIPGTKKIDPSVLDPGSAYTVVENRPGTYLYRQILLKSASSLDTNTHLSGFHFGPALFADPRTNRHRALTEAEHNALNKALGELIFPQKEGLIKSGPLYDFVKEKDPSLTEPMPEIDLSIYKVNDDTLREKLRHVVKEKDYSYLTDGLISHAGTYHDPDDGNRPRAYNLFIPESIYNILLELLERKSDMPEAKDLIDYWKFHELLHFLDRNNNIDEEMGESSPAFPATILFLAKARRAQQQRDYLEAARNINQAFGLYKGSAFIFEIQGDIFSSMGNWDRASTSYMTAISNMNSSEGLIRIGHHLENKTLDAITKAIDCKMTSKEFHSAVLKLLDIFETSTDLPDSVLQGLDITKEQRKYSEQSAYEYVYFVHLPLVFNYIRQSLQKGSSCEDIIAKLLDMIGEGKLVNPKNSQLNGFIISYIYFLAGDTKMLSEDFGEAYRYYEEGIKHNDVPPLYARKAIALVRKDPTSKSLKIAQNILNEAERTFGPQEAITEAKKCLEEEEAAIKLKEEMESVYKKARRLFENSQYSDCCTLIDEMEKKTGRDKLSGSLKVLKRNAVKCMELKEKGTKALEFEYYEEAQKIFGRLLEINPHDKEIQELNAQIPNLQKEKAERDEQLSNSRKLLQEAESFLLKARHQRKVGARKYEQGIKNCNRALEALGKIIISDESIEQRKTELKAEIDEELKGLKSGVPVTTEKGLPPEPKKKRRKTEPAAPDIQETPIPEKSREFFMGLKKKALVSREVITSLEELEQPKFQNKILRAMEQVSAGDMTKVEGVKGSAILSRIKCDRFRVCYLITDKNEMLVVWMEWKKNVGDKYETVRRRFPDNFDYSAMRNNALPLKKVKKLIQQPQDKKGSHRDTHLFMAVGAGLGVIAGIIMGLLTGEVLRQMWRKRFPEHLRGSPSWKVKLGDFIFREENNLLPSAVKKGIDKIVCHVPNVFSKITENNLTDLRPGLHGMAVFFDITEGKERCLNKKMERQNGSSDHTTLTAALERTVLKENKQPLSENDPFCIFINDKLPNMKIYTVDDNTKSKRHAGLKVNIVFYTGIYKESENDAGLKYCLFVSESMHDVFLEILKIKKKSKKLFTKLKAWREQIEGYVESRDIENSTGILGERLLNFLYDRIDFNIAMEAIFRSIYLRRKKGRDKLTELFEESASTLKDYGEIAFLDELAGRACEAMGVWGQAYCYYIESITTVALSQKKHKKLGLQEVPPLIDNALDMIKRMSNGRQPAIFDFINKKLNELEALQYRTAGLIEYFRKLYMGYLGLFPLICRYIDMTLQDSSASTKTHRKNVIKKLINLVSKHNMFTLGQGKHINSVFAGLFELAGRASLYDKDYKEADEYFRQSIDYDPNFPGAHAGLVIAIVNKYGTMVSFKSALKILEKAEKKFGPLEILSKTKDNLEIEKNNILIHEEALELFRSGDYQKCCDYIRDKKSKIGNGAVLYHLKELNTRAARCRELLKEGKQAFDRGRYEDAERYFRRLLAINPSDRGIRNLVNKIPGLIKKKKKEDEYEQNVKGFIERINQHMSVAEKAIEHGEKQRAIDECNSALDKLKKLEETGDKNLLNLIKEKKSEIEQKINYFKSLEFPSAEDKKKTETPERIEEKKPVAPLIQGREKRKDFEGFKKKALIARDVISALRELRQDRNKILRAIEQVSNGNIRNVKKVEGSNILWRIRCDKHRICYISGDNGEMLVVWAGWKRDTGDKYENMRRLFPDNFDYRTIRKTAVPLKKVKGVIKSWHERSGSHRDTHLLVAVGVGLTVITEIIAGILIHEVLRQMWHDRFYKNLKDSHPRWAEFGSRIFPDSPIVPLPGFIVNLISKYVNPFLIKLFSLIRVHGGWLYDLIIKKDEINPDEQSLSGGPALFLDPETGVVRKLMEVCRDGSGRISEHKAVNEACKELVFDRGKTALASGNPLYDFFKGNDLDKKENIYVINDDELREKLTQKGYPDLIDGLITHTGTYRYPGTSQARAYNIFVPESVYKTLLEFLKRKSDMLFVDVLLDFWKFHEIKHLFDRDADIDEELSDTEKLTVKHILFLSKAMKALGKESLGEALEYANKVFEINKEFPFVPELKGRINEAKKDFLHAYKDYLVALTEMNAQKGEIIAGHPLEEKALELFMRGGKNNIKWMRKLRINPKFSHNIFINLIETANEMPLKAGTEPYRSRELLIFFGFIPIMCAYVNRTLQNKDKVTPFEIEIMQKLLDMAKKGKVVNPINRDITNVAVSRIYYLAGELNMVLEKFDKAFDCFEQALIHNPDMPILYVRKAVSLLSKKETRESLREAYEVLESAEEIFGNLDIFKEGYTQISEKSIKIKAKLEEEREFEKVYADAFELFKEGLYDDCQVFIIEAENKTQSISSPQRLTGLKRKAHSMGKKKKRGIDLFEKERYPEAIKVFDEILKQNPSDTEAVRIKTELSELREKDGKEKKALVLLQSRLKEVKGFVQVADRQVKSGRIDRARRNYKNAQGILFDISVSDDKDVLQLTEEIKQKLIEIKDLPSRIEREEHADEPSAPGKRKREKTIVPEPEKEKNIENEKNSVSKTQRKEIRLSRKANDELKKRSPKEQERLLSLIKHPSASQRRDIMKIATHDSLYRIRHDEYRIVYTVLDNGTMLTLKICKKPEMNYRNVLKQFPENFDYTLILQNSIRIEDFEEDLDIQSMKAPASLSLDEDKRVDFEYVTGLISKATERTGDVKLTEAAAYINKHAPPFKNAKIDPRKIKIFTVELGNKLGIPRFKDAKKARDLIYTYPIFNRKTGVLELYVTRKYFDSHLRDNVLALSEVIDHENTEKVLGYSHRVAASRSHKFIPEYGFLSPFHYFYINQIISEGDYSAAKAIRPDRFASKDVIEVYGKDKGIIKEIKAYERRFFDYLRLMEWFKKADKERNHDVLAEYSLRIHRILEKYPKIVLTDKQKRIFERISDERFYIHEFKNTPKVHMPLSEFSLEDLKDYDDNAVFLDSKLGSGGELYAKGQKRPLVKIVAYAGNKIAFNLKSGDIYRIWILDNENNVIDFRQMGQIYGADGKFRRRFYYKITRPEFDLLGDCVIKDYRLTSEGVLGIGGRVINFGAYYANCNVEIRVKSGQIESVRIYDEYGRQIKEAEFALICDKNNRILGSFYRNLTRKELGKLDNVTIKRFRLNSKGALNMGNSGDPVPYFHQFPNAEVEIDMIQGHIDKVRILGEDGKGLEEHIFKLVYNSEGKVVCSFNELISEEDFKKITGRVTRLRSSKELGKLSAGGLLGVFGEFKDFPAEADVERGITKTVYFYKDVEKRELAGKPIKYSLIYDDNGKLIDSFKERYMPSKRKKLKKAVVKELYLNGESILKWGGLYWGKFEDIYARRKIEFDVTNGIIVEVRIFDKDEKEIEKICPFSLVYEIGKKGREKLVDSFWSDYVSDRFRKLTNHVIKTVKLTKIGGILDIGGRIGKNQNMPRAKFPGHEGEEVIVYVKNGEVHKVTDIAGRELEGTYYGRTDTKISSELTVPKTAKEIVENARYIIPRLVQAMMDIAANVSDKDDKVILFLDEDLTSMTKKDIKKEIERLISRLTNVKANNDDLLRFLNDKLEIRSGKGEKFSSKKGKIKNENVIVVTTKSNQDMGYFSAVEGKGIIAAINDKDFPENNYLPLLEVAFFAIGKYLKWNEKTLSECYKAIPNAVSLRNLSKKQRDSLFREEMRNFVIRLIPDATVKTKDIVESIAIIRDILSKA